MNLQHLIEGYITYRQTLGARLQDQACFLRAFGRAIGASADVCEVRAEQVGAFLAGTKPGDRSWHRRHTALLGFYRYAVSRGHVASAPLPAVLPNPPAPFVPYVYSREEVRKLLRATDTYQQRSTNMEPITMRTFVLLLYGTGLRSGEAVALDRADVDLNGSLLTVRQGKFRKTRLVPFGSQLREVLAQYLNRRSATADPAPFFTTSTGARVRQDTVEGCFRRVCEQAGVSHSDGTAQPRLHDLRHTFAVHRLTSWYREGANVQKLLPQLSVYLGHVHVSCTQVYLSMTSELLGEASARFERYARRERDHG